MHFLQVLHSWLIDWLKGERVCFVGQVHYTEEDVQNLVDEFFQAEQNVDPELFC